MIYNNLVYCGVGCVVLGVIILYLLLLCQIYAYIHVCIDEGEYVAAVLCSGSLFLVLGAGLLIVGLGAF